MTPDHLTGSCLTTLNAWIAPDRAQDDLRRRYLAHLAAHPADGWSRSCTGAHLTASSLIVAAGAGVPVRVLLTLHRRIGRWLQTGGHLEPADASLEAAALREAVEESGIADLELDPDPLLLSRHAVRCGPVDPCYHLDVQYLVRAVAGAQPVRSEESADLRWFPATDHPADDDSVNALVAAGCRRVGEPGPGRDRDQPPSNTLT